MASESKSAVTTASLVLIGVILSMVCLTASSQELMSPNSAGLWGYNSRSHIRMPMMRRFDCSAICRKTGYSGYIGGCQCGFTLFTKRTKGPFDVSSDDSNSFPYALSSMEEAIANLPSSSSSTSSSSAPSSSSDEGQVIARDNLFRSPAFRSAPVASSSNGLSRAACAGLCDRSK